MPSKNTQALGAGRWTLDRWALGAGRWALDRWALGAGRWALESTRTGLVGADRCVRPGDDAGRRAPGSTRTGLVGADLCVRPEDDAARWTLHAFDHLARVFRAAIPLLLIPIFSGTLAGQTPPAATSPPAPPPPAIDYIVGPQDVLTITSYDQADLSGKFTVEADGTFTYPLIGRFKAGGLTLRAVEETLKKRLKDDGYFKNPQVTAAVETYKSQKVFVVGEVRMPGTYPLSGNMNLVEAIARAGSTLPTASGEAVIVHAGEQAAGPTMPGKDAAEVVRVNLRELEQGAFSQNAALRDGDTIFVPRAESVYVFGQVKSPGAYALQQKNTTVLQALSLAGGVTDRGSTGRIKIIRIVDGEKRELKVKLTDAVVAGDTIMVGERFF